MVARWLDFMGLSDFLLGTNFRTAERGLGVWDGRAILLAVTLQGQQNALQKSRLAHVGQ